MALIKLAGDGQEIPMDDAIANNDDLLKRALTPFYPEMANAQIRREQIAGQLVVSLVKQAGSKGSPAVLPMLATSLALDDATQQAPTATLVATASPNSGEAATFAPDSVEGAAPSEEGDDVLRLETSKRGQVVSEMRRVQKQVLDALTSPATPEQLNPVLKAAWLIKTREINSEFDLAALMELQPMLHEAILVAQQEVSHVEQSLNTLKNAPATICRSFTFPGF